MSNFQKSHRVNPKNKRLSLWAAIAVAGVEPFFVPLKVFTAFFGFAAHALVFICRFVNHID
jgi:hypothetical protein